MHDPQDDVRDTVIESPDEATRARYCRILKCLAATHPQLEDGVEWQLITTLYNNPARPQLYFTTKTQDPQRAGIIAAHYNAQEGVTAQVIEATGAINLFCEASVMERIAGRVNDCAQARRTV